MIWSVSMLSPSTYLAADRLLHSVLGGRGLWGNAGGRKQVHPPVQPRARGRQDAVLRARRAPRPLPARLSARRGGRAAAGGGADADLGGGGRGGGTGISAELFLAIGNTVYAVEANPDMLAAAKRAHGATHGSTRSPPRRRGRGCRPRRSTSSPRAGVPLARRPAAAREFRQIAKRAGGWPSSGTSTRGRGHRSRGVRRDASTYGTDYASVSARITTADDFARLFGGVRAVRRPQRKRSTSTACAAGCCRRRTCRCRAT